MSDNQSKDDTKHHAQSSLENVMDAVVAIQGGEVSLKNGGGSSGPQSLGGGGNNHRQASVKRNTTEQQIKTENSAGGRHGKIPISNFESPTKAGAQRREFYNKTQTMDETNRNTNAGGLLP